jgi:hypothetical protein
MGADGFGARGAKPIVQRFASLLTGSDISFCHRLGRYECRKDNALAQTIELVTFQIKPEAERTFVADNAPVTDWLKRQPGFVMRQLGQKDDGSWLDLVLWQSHEDAVAASEKLMVDLKDCAVMQAIDPQTMVMAHASVVVSS